MNEIAFTRSEIINGVLHLYKITFRKSGNQIMIIIESVKGGTGLYSKPVEEHNAVILLSDEEVKRLKEFLDSEEINYPTYTLVDDENNYDFLVILEDKGMAYVGPLNLMQIVAKKKKSEKNIERAREILRKLGYEIVDEKEGVFMSHIFYIKRWK